MKKYKYKIEHKNISKVYTVTSIHTDSKKYKDMLLDMLNNSLISNSNSQIP